jgi:DNA polymerase III alpha subunit
MNYADLQVTTHFSFLRGASSPEELFASAALLRIKALGIVDRNSLAGIVRAYEAAKTTGVRLIVGCRLDLQCGTSLLVYPTDRAAYGRLCRLLTIGKTRAGKGQCHLDWSDVEAWHEGLLAILLPDDLTRELPGELIRLRRIFGDRAYCALTRRFLPDEAARLRMIATAATQARVATIATNDVLYHCASRRMLQDVMTCIRLHTTVDNAGFQKERHADRYLKPPEEMLRLFPKYKEAVHRSWEIAERCRFSLDQLTYTYPTELGDMVHPYIRRREGKEDVYFPTKALEKVLGKTLGVPLFQEQAMQVAMVAAGFTPTEADQLRRAMATFKHTGGVNAFQEKLITGMLDNGYTKEFADRTFRQLEGFGSYGFPESHAASFALLAYASSWMKCHHPDVFLAAILNAQPMGFYAPAQLVRDAKDHGVEVRTVDINQSTWDCTLETTKGNYHAVRLGFCMVRGLTKKDVERIVAVRETRAYSSIEDLWRRAHVPVASLNGIARADGFRGLGLSRREAIKGLRDEALPLFAAADDRDGQLRPEAHEPAVALTPMTMGREVVEDYRTKGLSLRAHPLAFLRQSLADRGYLPCAALRDTPDGRRISIAGLVLVRQMPGSAKGVMFITLEDEAESANLIVWPSVFEKNRRTILSASMLGCRGKVQRASDVIHLIVEQLTDLTADLKTISGLDVPFPLVPGRGDEAKHGGHGPDSRDPRPVTKSRDIYVPDLHIDTIKLKARNFR